MIHKIMTDRSKEERELHWGIRIDHKGSVVLYESDPRTPVLKITKEGILVLCNWPKNFLGLKTESYNIGKYIIKTITEEMEKIDTG